MIGRGALRTVVAGMLAVVLCGCAAIPALAAEGVDPSRTGSIEVAMACDGTAVAGGSLTLHKVGEYVESDQGPSFSLAEVFAESGVSLDLGEIETADLAEELATYATDEGIEGRAYAIDEVGRARMAGLSVGLYLVTQPEAAEGYEPVAPFLVSIPLYDKTEGAYVYDVKATPKMGEVEASPTGGSEDGGALSRTGDPTPLWAVPVIAAVGAMLVGCGVALLRRREGDHASRHDIS